MGTSRRGGGSRQRRSVGVLQRASADIERLREDDPRLALRARALVDLLETGEIEGEELELLPSYGDLRDCRKIYFGRSVDEVTHRLVYQVVETAAGTKLEVVEVVAVEARDDGYVYLLAAERLGRLPAETRPKLNRVHQGAIARRADKRRASRRDG